MELHELRQYEPINDVEEKKVESIKQSILDGTFSCPPVLIWNDEIMTGSHRVVAAVELVLWAEVIDDPIADEVYNFDIETLDVSEIMERYVAEHPYATIDYSALSIYFEGTDAEDIVKQNCEW